VGKRQKQIEIIVQKGDKITIKNINGRNLTGEVTNIKDESADVMLFDGLDSSNIKIHHIEIMPVISLPSTNPISEIYTFSEAAEIWGIDPSTLRHRVTSADLISGSDYKKSGKVWLITKSAMERLYGVR
jgi:hypothetical protein